MCRTAPLRHALAGAIRPWFCIFWVTSRRKSNVRYDWDDSIIVDREVEFARLMSMAAAGMIRPEYVTAWYYGVSLDDARAMMPEAEPDNPPPEEEE